MTVEELRSFFGWGAVCNTVFLLVLLILYLSFRDTINHLYSHAFSIQKETINAILFGVMVFYELAIFTFFVIPYIVLRFFM